MNKIILIIIVCISFLFGVDSSFQAGVSFYDARSENSNGLVANSIQIDQAINEFKKVSQDQELDAGIYLLRCYYFKGKFVEQTEKNKKNYLTPDNLKRKFWDCFFNKNNLCWCKPMISASLLILVFVCWLKQ